MNETLNTVQDLATKGTDRMTSLVELNMSLCDRLAAKQLNALNGLMDQGNRTLTMASTAKGYNGLLKSQIEMAKGFSDWVMAETKDSLTMANKVRDDYQAWYQVQMKDLSMDLGKAVPAI